MIRHQCVVQCSPSLVNRLCTEFICWQVKALAALYGAEPRACGRTGITLFKTSHACLPDEYKQQQVCLAATILDACSPACMETCSQGCNKHISCCCCQRHPVCFLLQVNNLLANSTATQNAQPAAHSAGVKKKRSCSKMRKQKHREFGSHQLLQFGHGAEQGPAIGQIHAPALDSTNVGSKMLVSMGWEAGTGLGSAMQGQLEPVPIIKRQKLLGLGA